MKLRNSPSGFLLIQNEIKCKYMKIDIETLTYSKFLNSDSRNDNFSNGQVFFYTQAVTVTVRRKTIYVTTNNGGDIPWTMLCEMGICQHMIM